MSDFTTKDCYVVFASAHPARIASRGADERSQHFELCLSTSRTDCIRLEAAPLVGVALCLSTSRTDCIAQRVLAPVIRVALCLSTSRTDCISKIAQMQCHKSTQYAVSW